jgi:sarcosine oxidase
MVNAEYDSVVIGAGMIGAAAARHLTAEDGRVLVVGPDEPRNWRRHRGVFASHYDEGRITRVVDPDPLWALLARRSIASYGPIEHASGIRFHRRNGGLRVASAPDGPDDALVQAERTARRLGATVRRLSEVNLSALFPALCFAPASVALWERGGAGYINPRALIAAQLRLAQRRGAELMRDTAVGLDRRRGGVDVHTEGGRTYRARRVLVAAGAFSNHLLDGRLDLRVRPATILLAEVSSREAAGLRALPTVIARLADHPTFQSFYWLPPMPYPDGRRYVKIGGTPLRGTHLATWDEQQAWFHGDGSQAEGAQLRELLIELVPSLRVATWHTRPCVLAYTVHGRPYIDEIDDGIFVAVGGNGAAAKSSTEIGRIAARLVARGRWSYDLEREEFGVRTARAA